jgi:WD40 repeat protein
MSSNDSRNQDGTLVAVAGITGYEWDNAFSIDVFDRASGRLLRRLRGLPNLAECLGFSPDGRWLAAGLAGKSDLRVWNTTRWAEPFQDGEYGDLIAGTSWSADGRLATSSYDGRLRLYRVADQGLTKLASVAAPGNKPFGLTLSPDGLSLAVGYVDESQRARIDVLDANSLSLRFAPDMSGVTNGVLARVAWSLDGRSLYAAGTWGLENVIVRRWPDSGRGKPVDVQASTRRQVTALRPLPGGGVLVAAANFWGAIDAHDVWHPRGLPPVAELRNKQTDVWGEAIQDFQGYALSQDGSRVQFGFERDGAAPYRFDVRRRTLTQGTAADLFPPNVSGLKLERWDGDYLAPASLDGKRLALDPDERSLGLAISASGRTPMLAHRT